MNTNNNESRKYLIRMVAIAVALANLVSLAMAYDDIRYDPEHQDGIPVISSRSLAPEMRRHYDDHGGVLEPVSESQRRNSDADLDDASEDDDENEDRDEYKSGSINHDTYENPSFGESRRAAKDGDDIENFFDRHLGPQDAIESREDNEVPIISSESPSRSSSSSSSSPSSSSSGIDDDDDDDHYETAASGPIATIISSILNKRPLIITATTGGGGGGGSSSSSDSAANEQDSKTSASDEKQTTASNSDELVSQLPVAFFTPFAASSNAAAYGLASQSSLEGGSQSDADEAAPDYGQVREIYITRRRPSSAAAISSHQHQQQQQAAAAPPQRYHLYPVQAAREQRVSQLIQQSSSNANYRRGAAAAAASRPFVMDGADGQQYMRYPVAASYVYQRNQAESNQPADEEQTVSYGLSFGRSPLADSDADEQPESGASDEQQQSANEAGAEYGAGHDDRRTSAAMAGYSSMRSYGPQPQAMMSPEQQRQYYQQQAMFQQQLQQAQLARGGARYHKDPSESILQPVNYVQYRSSSLASNRRPIDSALKLSESLKSNKKSSTTNEATLIRDRLLADLDSQIKANPHYWQHMATSSSTETRNGGKRPIRQQPSASSSTDVDTYSSYHSEVSPHKSLTTTSRLISTPSNHREPPPDLNGRPASSQQSSSDNAAAAGQMGAASFFDSTVGGDLLRNKPLARADSSNVAAEQQQQQQIGNSRVRRDDSEERESEADDDGVWVDDDEDDDNRQQSSDVNETAQDAPEDAEDEEEDDAQSEDTNESHRRANLANNPATNNMGVIGGPHGYEISPDDLMVYSPSAM